MFNIIIGAVLENTTTKKILILKRSETKQFAPGQWEIVLGRLKQFESPKEGIKREISEETGLEDSLIKRVINTGHHFRGENIPKNEHITINFWCQTDNDEISISDEHTEYKWVNPEEALETIQIPSLKEIIEDFINEKQS